MVFRRISLIERRYNIVIIIVYVSRVVRSSGQTICARVPFRFSGKSFFSPLPPDATLRALKFANISRTTPGTIYTTSMYIRFRRVLIPVAAAAVVVEII